MDKAEKIVNEIEIDICDRGGLGNEWQEGQLRLL